jgi:hypothetical protein
MTFGFIGDVSQFIDAVRGVPRAAFIFASFSGKVGTGADSFDIWESRCDAGRYDVRGNPERYGWS